VIYRVAGTDSPTVAAGRIHTELHLPQSAASRHNEGVVTLSWQPSAALRVLVAVRGVVKLGVFYLVTFLFFPHVLLVPVSAVAVLILAVLVIPVRVTLDPGSDEVVIRVGWWVRRVPLIEIESVDQALRLGAVIKLRKGTTYSFSPYRKPHPRLARMLHIRTGFEDMELAITGAAAAAREAAGLDVKAAPEDVPAGYLAGFLICGVGLAAIGIAILIHPQVDVPVVHTAAALLRIFYALGAAVTLLIGLGILVSRVWRGFRPAGPSHHTRPA
jgi:hypothetical protein